MDILVNYTNIQSTTKSKHLPCTQIVPTNSAYKWCIVWIMFSFFQPGGYEPMFIMFIFSSINSIHNTSVLANKIRLPYCNIWKRAYVRSYVTLRVRRYKLWVLIYAFGIITYILSNLVISYQCTTTCQCRRVRSFLLNLQPSHYIINLNNDTEHKIPTLIKWLITIILL